MAPKREVYEPKELVDYCIIFKAPKEMTMEEEVNLSPVFDILHDRKDE